MEYYHRFNYLERDITLCVVSDTLTETDYLKEIVISNYGLTSVNIGYSVKLPEDKSDIELGKSIALGRANKNPLFSGLIASDLVSRTTLYGIALHWEKILRKNMRKHIKGVKKC